MEKTIIAATLGAVALGAVDIERGDHGLAVPLSGGSGEHAPRIQLPTPGGNLRNLLLSAFGTRQPGPEQKRIPIPADGAMYEVIIAKPGLPRSVPVVKNDAD